MQDSLLQKIIDYVNVKFKITELKTKKSVADALAYFTYHLLFSISVLLLSFFLFFLVPFLFLLHFELFTEAFLVAFTETILTLIIFLSLKNKIIGYLKNILIKILDEYAS